MKISHEVKVGAVTLLTIAVFIWLFNFLKGKDYLRKTAYYYSVFDDIGGLSESSPVEINGFKVGVVQAVKLLDRTSGKLLVEYSVSNDFSLPVNSVAEIVPVSIIAGMKVQFLIGDGPGFYRAGDTIPGKLTKSIIVSIEEEFGPVKDKLLSLVTALDSVAASVDKMLDPEFKNNIEGIVSNLSTTTGSMNEIIRTREADLKNTIANLSAFAQMLSDNSANISGALNNLRQISDTVADSGLNASLASLSTSLAEASEILEKLNEGKGSAGQLLTDESLYANLSASLESLNLLLEDMKANPKRYVHFSLFGKKNIPAE
ncbi:MAG: MCE family protein [Bacteroidales bacterium]|jgi:phospholipid/cholesterol/gamma-HCH transport system substrate-binding protein|nr:MCE family protein [Bacteroidales bacterium]